MFSAVNSIGFPNILYLWFFRLTDPNSSLWIKIDLRNQLDYKLPHPTRRQDRRPRTSSERQIPASQGPLLPGAAQGGELGWGTSTLPEQVEVLQQHALPQGYSQVSVCVIGLIYWVIVIYRGTLLLFILVIECVVLRGAAPKVASMW